MLILKSWDFKNFRTFLSRIFFSPFKKKLFSDKQNILNTCKYSNQTFFVEIFMSLNRFFFK